MPCTASDQPRPGPEAEGVQHQRMVTWRLASPERAARSSPESWRVVGQRRGEVARGTSRPGPPAPRRRCRAEGPTPARAARARGTSPPAGRPRRSRPSRRRAAGPARRAARPRARASPSAGAPWSRRRSSTPPRPGSAARWARPRRSPGRGRPASSSLSSTSEIQKSNPSCTVTVSSLSVTRSCSRGPSPGGSVRPTTPGSRVERGLQHRAEVARGVAEVVLHLQPQPDLAAVAHHRRRGHRQQRAQRHRLVGALAPSAARWPRAPARASRRCRTPRAAPRTGGRRRPPRPRPPRRGRPCSACPSRTGTAAGGRPRRGVGRRGLAGLGARLLGHALEPNRLPAEQLQQVRRPVGDHGLDPELLAEPEVGLGVDRPDVHVVAGPGDPLRPASGARAAGRCPGRPASRGPAPGAASARTAACRPAARRAPPAPAAPSAAGRCS